MRRRHLAVPLAAVLPFALTGVAHAAHGEFAMSPTSGPAGTSITVSDSEGQCDPPAEAEDPFVGVLLFDEDDDVVNGNDTDLSETGNFTLTVKVPDDTPAGDLVVAVACFEGNEEDEEPFFVFEERTFTVKQASGPTQTAAPQPTKGTTTQATPKKAAPAKGKAPAKAVKAQPKYTG